MLLILNTRINILRLILSININIYWSATDSSMISGPEHDGAGPGPDWNIKFWFMIKLRFSAVPGGEVDSG